MTDTVRIPARRQHIEGLFESWRRGEAGEVAARFHAGARLELRCQGAVFDGRDAIARGWVAQSLVTYPTASWLILDYREVGDTAVVEYVFQGSAPDEDAPLQATGCAICRFRGAKIVSARIYSG